MTARISSPDRPLVMVEWVDSGTGSEPWTKRDELMKECEELDDLDVMCWTCGFLVHECESFITITLSLSNTEFGSHVTIPTEAIRRVRRIIVAPGQE